MKKIEQLRWRVGDHIAREEANMRICLMQSGRDVISARIAAYHKVLKDIERLQGKNDG